MIEKLQYPHLGILVLAWFLAYLFIPAIIRISGRIGALDRPGGHKAHGREVSFLGGIGIFLAFALAVLSTIRLRDEPSLAAFLVHPGYRKLLGIVIGALILLVLGVIDDFRPINAVAKLGVLLGVTGLIYFFGVRMSLVPAEQVWLAALVNVPLTVLWIAGVTSAVNSLDNMDGAVGGTAAAASAAIFYIAWGTSAADAQPWLSYVAVALLGACIGFLRFNYAPARVFLGDNGAFLVGFLLASMCVLGEWAEHPIKGLIVPCMILTVPLFDITLSTFLRWKTGIVKTIPQAILYCGQDHITHRMVALGLSKTQAVLTLWLFGAISGFLAIVVWKASDPMVVVSVMVSYFAMLGWFGTMLARVPGHRTPGPGAGTPGPGRPEVADGVKVG